MTVTRFGLTWWGRRWIGSLEALGAAYENRLPRGRTYARRGAVRRLEVAAGRVTARVDGSRAQPYRVTLRLPVFSDDQWDAIVAALARQVRHSAALLDGRMPDDVDETLAGCGLSLFPHTGELATTCSCPDHANPCKHVAAVHYVLAQTFDSDPFLLPALRGCGRDDLLAALRAARTGETPPAGGNDDEPGDGSGVPWRELSAAGLYQAADDLAAIAVHPQPPAERTATATVRRLGPPPLPGADAGEIVAAAVAAAADRAWLLATGVGDTAERALGSDEAAVLAEVRRLGSTTTRAVADHLDRPADLVRATLRTLVAAGLVTRTGHARGTRYRPS